MRASTPRNGTVGTHGTAQRIRETHEERRLPEIVQRYWKEYKETPADEPSSEAFVIGTAPRSGNSVAGHGTTGTNKGIPKMPDAVRPAAALRISFHPLQEWEGHVISVGVETFTARLTDLTNGATVAGEVAEFPIDDLSDGDREMLAVGRVFRWAIGYQRGIGGTKSRLSRIVFRRLPQWTEKDLIKAEKEAASLSAQLRWE